MLLMTQEDLEQFTKASPTTSWQNMEAQNTSPYLTKKHAYTRQPPKHYTY
jgi:hypothetical protein